MNITAKNIAALDASLKAVCPIDGVNSAGHISFKPEATIAQREAADAVLVAFLAAPEPTPLSTAEQSEADCQAALNDGANFHMDFRKLIKAKFISDLAFRLGKAPGALTAGELTAERNRIAAIYKTL